MAKPTAAEPAKQTRSERYGKYQLARDISNGIFSLLNTGKIIPLCMMMILFIIGIVAWRLPEAQLGLVAREFLTTLRESVGIALTLLFASNCGWIWLFRRQRDIYTQEIVRLADMRDRLIEGKATMTVLEQHTSSEGEQQESYPIPAQKAPKKKGH